MTVERVYLCFGVEFYSVAVVRCLIQAFLQSVGNLETVVSSLKTLRASYELHQSRENDSHSLQQAVQHRDW